MFSACRLASCRTPKPLKEHISLFRLTWSMLSQEKKYIHTGDSDSKHPIPGKTKKTTLNTQSPSVSVNHDFLWSEISSLHDPIAETQPKNDNFLVCVEGNIGCGKTTLLEHFKSSSQCEVIAEPVEKWRNIEGFNALELMYQDPSRWGMALQTYVQLTMLQNHTKPTSKLVKLMERSIFSAKYCFTDNLRDSGLMPELEHIILTKWFDWIIETQNITVDLIVYLRTDPELLHSRIMKRCRPEEAKIPIEYLKTLHQLHEDWLIHKKKYCPAEVLVIDSNASLEEMSQTYEYHKNKILHQN